MLPEFGSLDLPGLYLTYRPQGSPGLLEAGQVSASARALETDILIMEM